jgi:hypothetical protein
LEFDATRRKFEFSLPDGMTDTEPQVPQYAKRRSNFVLRALVDEMLEQVRALDRASATMSADDRAAAERELDALMARVRRAAMKGPAA